MIIIWLIVGPTGPLSFRTALYTCITLFFSDFHTFIGKVVTIVIVAPGLQTIMVLHLGAFMTFKPCPHIIRSQVQSPLMQINITDKHNVTLYFGNEVRYMKAT